MSSVASTGGYPPFDPKASRERVDRFRRRILEISQHVSALHIGGAFSAAELVEAVYFSLMRRASDGTSPDTFVMSKGHGAMIQYVILEHLGLLSRADLDGYCTAGGRIGTHPDRGLPGIEAATGSLGHGLSMAVGMAIAERNRERNPGAAGRIYCVLSDGEIQEGSTWEAILMGASLRLGNLVAIVDNNDFQSMGRTSETHPAFYPLVEKFTAFGWESVAVDGHDSRAITAAIAGRQGEKPFMLVAKTVKGKGVSYMEHVPMWHYRSPNPAEYRQALSELDAALAKGV